MNGLFHKCCAYGGIVLLALMSLAALDRTVFAADAPPPLGPSGPELGSDSADDISKYLGTVYSDEAAAIKLAPPLGSRVIHRAGLELMSFVQDSKQWVGNVQLQTLKGKLTVDDYMKMVAGELSKTFRAVQVLDSRDVPFEGRSAGRLAISMEGELGDAVGQQQTGRKQTVALYRQQLLVQMADNQFMVLTLYTPLKDRDAGTKTFEAMLTTFEIMDRDALTKIRAEAVKRGKAWLALRSADELKAKLIATPQLFRMKIAGGDVGYIRFDEAETQRDASKGVAVTVLSRSFPPGVAAVFGENVAYWAYSRDESDLDRPHYSSWENLSKTVVKRPDLPEGSYTYWVREWGTLQLEGSSHFTADQIEQLRAKREKMLADKTIPPDHIPPPIDVTPPIFHLRVALEGDPTQPPQQVSQKVDLPIPPNMPSVLPKILEYLWPRVTDLSKPGEMTFAVFNSVNKKMTLRTLAVKGKEKISVAGKSLDAIKCTDDTETGSTTLWVDDDGKILMMRTSDQSLLVPTTEQEMLSVWGSRLAMPSPPTSPGRTSSR